MCVCVCVHGHAWVCAWVCVNLVVYVCPPSSLSPPGAVDCAWTVRGKGLASGIVSRRSPSFGTSHLVISDKENFQFRLFLFAISESWIHMPVMYYGMVQSLFVTWHQNHQLREYLLYYRMQVKKTSKLRLLTECRRQLHSVQIVALIM